jgi:glutathione peroxidase
MKIFITLLMFISFLFGAKNMNIYDIEVKDINGKTFTMEKYKGKVMLIVNVASKCGFTYQYEGLEKLYDEYNKDGLEVLGFPCNQFLKQEPGTEQEIKAFCKLNYGVNFPMFSKLDVNGDNEHPLYTYLKKHSSGILGTDVIKWNFTKFLVDIDGTVVERYAPSTEPKTIEADIKKLLVD